MFWYLINSSLQVENLTVQHTYLACPSWILAFPAPTLHFFACGFATDLALWQTRVPFQYLWMPWWLLWLPTWPLGSLFLFSFVLSESAISFHMLCTCYTIAFVCLCLSSWDLYSWPHVMLFTFYAITKMQCTSILLHYLLVYKSAFVWICSELTVLHLTAAFIHNWHVYGCG